MIALKAKQRGFMLNPYRFGGASPNVALFLHLDGDYTDSSSYAHTPTAGTASLTGPGKFGSGAMQVAFANPALPTLTYPHNTALSTPGDFTLEGWIYATNLYYPAYLISKGGGASTAEYTLSVQSGNANFYMRNTTGDSFAATFPSIPTDRWVHIAGTREGAVIKVFVNGVSGTPVTFTGTHQTTSDPVGVGSIPEGYWNHGEYKLDEIRILNGLAAYTEDFTPPSMAFSNP